MIQRALNWGLEQNAVEDPNHMMNLASIIKEYEIPFAFSVVKIVRTRLQQLREIAEKKKKTEKERSIAVEERETALKAWKLLEGDKAKNVYDLEKQSFLDDYLCPRYYKITKGEIEDLELKITKFLLDCIYDKKDLFEDQLHNPTKYPNKPRPSAVQIKEERLYYEKEIDNVIENVEDPFQLYEIS